MIDFNSFTNLPKNVGDLDKIIVATSFEQLPKVQKIAKSDHPHPHRSLVRVLGFLLRYTSIGREKCDQIGRFIGLWATF